MTTEIKINEVVLNEMLALAATKKQEVRGFGSEAELKVWAEHYTGDPSQMVQANQGYEKLDTWFGAEFGPVDSLGNYHVQKAVEQVKWWGNRSQTRIVAQVVWTDQLEEGEYESYKTFASEKAIIYQS